VTVATRGDALELSRPVRPTAAGMGSSLGFGMCRYEVMPDGTRFVFATADPPPSAEIRLLSISAPSSPGLPVVDRLLLSSAGYSCITHGTALLPIASL
jgi:hypothetical protein